MKARHLLIVCIAAAALGLLQGCRQAEDVWENSGRTRVLTSFPPIYCFAKNVAGDDADVVCLLTTKGPHDYHSDYRDVLRARGADLFLVNGLGLDDFTERIANSTGRPNDRPLVPFKVGDQIPVKQRRKQHEDHDHGGEGHDHVHVGEHDPHAWLSPDLARIMVKAIADKLIAADPKNKSAYEQRCANYLKELEALKAHGLAQFEKKQNKLIVSSHEALGYFADAFKLTIAGSIMFRPGQEVDAKALAKLTELCKEKGIRVITIEPQYRKDAATILQNELKSKGITVELVEVDPLETAAAAPGSINPDPAVYLERMKQNIDNLAKALQ